VYHLMETTSFRSLEDGKKLRSSLKRDRIPCEDASFYFFYMHRVRPGKIKTAWGNPPHQSIDVLDFCIYHLSTLERLVKNRQDKDVPNMLDKYQHVFQEKNKAWVRALAGIPDNRSLDPQLHEKLDQTVVIVPFIIMKRGDGNSRMDHRARYLEIMFWSLYPIFPKIVFAVRYQEDKDLVLKLGYPIWDLFLLDDLGTDCGLPMASVVEARHCLKGERCGGTQNWPTHKLRYVYFTEGDQILQARDLMGMFGWADRHKKAVLLPHRLVTTPPSYLDKVGKTLASNSLSTSVDIHKSMCCLDTDNIDHVRLHWKHFSDPALQVNNVHGVGVVFGHANYWSQTYRTCNLTKNSHPSLKFPSTSFDAEIAADQTALAQIARDSLVLRPVCSRNPVSRAYTVNPNASYHTNR